MFPIITYKVDENKKLIASIFDKNILLRNGYKAVITTEDEKCFRDNKGEIEVVRPEVTA